MRHGDVYIVREVADGEYVLDPANGPEQLRRWMWTWGFVMIPRETADQLISAGVVCRDHFGPGDRPCGKVSVTRPREDAGPR